MTTLQILIVCLAVLLGLVIVVIGVLGRDQRGPLDEQERYEFRREVLECLTLLVEQGFTAADERSAEQAQPAPSLVGATVVVNTRKPDDQSIRGIVVAHHADRLTLREALYLQGGGPGASADGLIHIPAAAVSSVQEVVVTAQAEAA